jgi:putative Ca2+/H+ antiporter (TMEM165/GDT1 family)
MLKIASIFVAVFIAELGDKTQLATLLFASEGEHSPLTIFFAAAGALVLSTALAVLIGTMGAKYLETVPLKLISGLGFVAIGVWTLAEHFRAA